MRKLSLLFLLSALLNISCKKDNAVQQDEQYSFSGPSTGCGAHQFTGSYVKTILINETNNLDVKVEVYKTGAWSLATNSVNGVSFSGSGNFTSLGIQTIRLNGSGRPLQQGTFYLILKSGKSYCSLTLKVDAAAVGAPCVVATNSILNVPGYSCLGNGNGVSYLLQANSPTTSLVMEFFSGKPIAGIYEIVNPDVPMVRKVAIYSTRYPNGQLWGLDGNVYVAVSPTGKVSATFCSGHMTIQNPSSYLYFYSSGNFTEQ